MSYALVWLPFIEEYVVDVAAQRSAKCYILNMNYKIVH